jgi:hypothetical protein
MKASQRTASGPTEGSAGAAPPERKEERRPPHPPPSDAEEEVSSAAAAKGRGELTNAAEMSTMGSASSFVGAPEAFGPAAPPAEATRAARTRATERRRILCVCR